MRKRNQESQPNITRMDFGRYGRLMGNTHGWFVRVVRRRKQYSKFFADKTHGGKKAALKKAIEFRNIIISKAPEALRRGGNQRKWYERPPSGRIQRKTCTYIYKDGYCYEYEAFSAWIRISPNEIMSTKWSINKHGVAEARRRIEAWLKIQQKVQSKNYVTVRKCYFQQKSALKNHET